MSEYLKLLMSFKSRPRTFQCDYVRYNASLVAEASSRGHISCLNTSGRNNGAWEITSSGIKFLKKHGGCI